MTRKWIPISVCAALVIALGSFTTYKSFAGGPTKVQEVEQLKISEKDERAKLEKMPNMTKEEMDATIQQGMKIKEMSGQVNKLDAELHPEETRKKKIEQSLYDIEVAYSDGIGYVKELASKDPSKAAKASENMKLEKKMIDQLKKDLAENKKSLDELEKQVADIFNLKIVE